MPRNLAPAEPKPAPRTPAPDGYDSVVRLMHLARVADMQAAAARDLQQRRNDVAAAISDKRREQQLFTQQPNIDSKRFAAVGEEIAALEAQRDALAAAQRQAANAAADALRLHENCGVFAYQNGLPRPSSLTSAAAMVEGAIQ